MECYSFDRKMNVKIKGKVYRTVVRPALVYGEETLAMKKAHESGGRRNMNATIDVRSYETVQDRKWKNMGGQRNWAKLQRKSKKVC